MQAISNLSRHLLRGTLSLSLVGMAGCAAPVTAPTAGTEAAPATAVPAEAQPGAAAPAQVETAAAAAPTVPAVVATESVSLQGTVSFRGEPLVGYQLTAFDAVSGAARALEGNKTTDAKGGFDLKLAGKAGEAVRLVATKAHVQVEATFLTTATAAGYTVQAADGLRLDEVSTLLSHIAGGPLRASAVLTPDAARETISAYMNTLGSLRESLKNSIDAGMGLSNSLVTGATTDKEKAALASAIDGSIANAGQLQPLMNATADLVKKLHESAQKPENLSSDAGKQETRDSLSKLQFAGTQLQFSLGDKPGEIQLTNTRSGRTVDAGSAEGLRAVQKVVRPKHKKSTAMVFKFPTTHNPFFTSQFAMSTYQGAFVKDTEGSGQVYHLYTQFNGTVDLETSDITEFGPQTVWANDYPWVDMKFSAQGELQTVDVGIVNYVTAMSGTVAAPGARPVKRMADTTLPSPMAGVTPITYQFDVSATDEPALIELTVYVDSGREVVGFRMWPLATTQADLNKLPNPGLALYYTLEGYRQAVADTWQPADLYTRLMQAINEAASN